MIALTASTAGAFSLRAPQVGFNNSTLQGYLDSVDGGINTTTDQVNAQVFSTGFTGNTDFTLVLKTASGAAIGVYNSTASGTPTLFQLFPSAAVAGYSVYCHFDASGALAVHLYDDVGAPLGTTNYSGVDRNHFGFYLTNGSTTYYGQDGRNGGNAHVLTYAGTGYNYGDWFECFESSAYNSGSSTFTGAIVLLQSVAPTPTRTESWGSLKNRYR